MAIEIRMPGEDDVEAMFHADARALRLPLHARADGREPDVIDLSRYRIAVEAGEVVGVIGSYAFDVTLPGGAAVPMGAVTWVGVAATHRRQGLLRRLMAACHDDIDARGEPVAMLFASEGGIYERFGYGVATRLWMIEIDTRRRPSCGRSWCPRRAACATCAATRPPRTSPRLWERYRRTRPGEISRPDNWRGVLHA